MSCREEGGCLVKPLFSRVTDKNYTYVLLDNPYLATLLTSAGDERRTDLQVFGQFSDRLLQEKGHEEEIEGRDVSVLREKGLKNGKAWEVTSIPVNLPDRRSATGAPADVEP
ncbi:hypothetical protein llap_21543 [Limosa lapponica baueri]|uniref:Uncharacterized protein n=1 Tax=Limosa lapponica baueri TaxID=1758121 RepID=A0A2I0T2Y5_LIMLA|nr:hypothetical protein llap_21543 [Limosa lapponica baueri]